MTFPTQPGQLPTDPQFAGGAVAAEPTGMPTWMKVLIGAGVSVVVVFVLMVAAVSYMGNQVKTSFSNISNTLPL